jgi:hypothetical protein
MVELSALDDRSDAEGVHATIGECARGGIGTITQSGRCLEETFPGLGGDP